MWCVAFFLSNTHLIILAVLVRGLNLESPSPSGGVGAHSVVVLPLALYRKNRIISTTHIGQILGKTIQAKKCYYASSGGYYWCLLLSCNTQHTAVYRSVLGKWCRGGGFAQQHHSLHRLVPLTVCCCIHVQRRLISQMYRYMLLIYTAVYHETTHNTSEIWPSYAAALFRLEISVRCHDRRPSCCFPCMTQDTIPPRQILLARPLDNKE